MSAAPASQPPASAFKRCRRTVAAARSRRSRYASSPLFAAVVYAEEASGSARSLYALASTRRQDAIFVYTVKSTNQKCRSCAQKMSRKWRATISQAAGCLENTHAAECYRRRRRRRACPPEPLVQATFRPGIAHRSLFQAGGDALPVRQPAGKKQAQSRCESPHQQRCLTPARSPQVACSFPPPEARSGARKSQKRVSLRERAP